MELYWQNFVDRRTLTNWNSWTTRCLNWSSNQWSIGMTGRDFWKSSNVRMKTQKVSQNLTLQVSSFKKLRIRLVLYSSDPPFMGFQAFLAHPSRLTTGTNTARSKGRCMRIWKKGTACSVTNRPWRSYCGISHIWYGQSTRVPSLHIQ